jgi:hypothetical protein
MINVAVQQREEQLSLVVEDGDGQVKQHQQQQQQQEQQQQPGATSRLAASLLSTQHHGEHLAKTRNNLLRSRSRPRASSLPPQAGQRITMWWNQAVQDAENDNDDDDDDDDDDDEPAEVVSFDEASRPGRERAPRPRLVDPVQQKDDFDQGEQQQQEQQQQQDHDFSEDANANVQTGLPGGLPGGAVTIDAGVLSITEISDGESPSSPSHVSSSSEDNNISILRVFGTLQLVITIVGYALLLRMARRYKKGGRRLPLAEQDQKQQQRRQAADKKPKKKLRKTEIKQKHECTNGPLLSDPQGVDNMLLAGGFQQVTSDKNNSAVTTVGDSSTLCIILEQVMPDEEEKNPLPHLKGKFVQSNSRRPSLVVKCHSVSSLLTALPTPCCQESSAERRVSAPRALGVQLDQKNGCLLGSFDLDDDSTGDTERQLPLWETDDPCAAPADIPHSSLVAKKCKRAPLLSLSDVRREDSERRSAVSGSNRTILITANTRSPLDAAVADIKLGRKETNLPQDFVADAIIKLTDQNSSSLIVTSDNDPLDFSNDLSYTKRRRTSPPPITDECHHDAYNDHNPDDNVMVLKRTRMNATITATTKLEV